MPKSKRPLSPYKKKSSLHLLLFLFLLKSWQQIDTIVCMFYFALIVATCNNNSLICFIYLPLLCLYCCCSIHRFYKTNKITVVVVLNQNFIDIFFSSTFLILATFSRYPIRFLSVSSNRSCWTHNLNWKYALLKYFQLKCFASDFYSFVGSKKKQTKIKVNGYRHCLHA